MKKLLVILGTRPEAIKMASLITEIRQHPTKFQLYICVTAQHREMLDQVLEFFEIVPNYDLNLMKSGQNLFELTSAIINNLLPVFEDCKPDVVLVHGDTTTSVAGALASFYFKTTIAHIEAGLRSKYKYAPFPEEINRQLTARLADLHFAPTTIAKQNLLMEGIKEDNIAVTGNTIFDSLNLVKNKLLDFCHPEIEALKKLMVPGKKTLLVTIHRRENFGEPFKVISKALQELANRKDITIIYPVHYNPEIQQQAKLYLQGHDHIHLITPLNYPCFIWLMLQSFLVLTDSGGLQEEGPALGKPVLLMRDNTERPEMIASNAVKMVGTSHGTIVSEVNRLMDEPAYYLSMKNAKIPFKMGGACKQIIETLCL